jgi:hypothetical protein
VLDFLPRCARDPEQMPVPEQGLGAPLYMSQGL